MLERAHWIFIAYPQLHSHYQ